MQGVSQNITVIQNKINKLQKEIQVKQAEIEKNKALIENNKDSILTSLNLSYKLSMFSPVELFFSGSDPSLTEERVTYVSYITSSNKKLLDDLTAKTDNLILQENKLKQDEQNLTEFLKDKEAEQDTLKQEVDLKNQLLNSLRQQKLSDLTKETLLEQEIKKEQAKIEELIKEANKGNISLKGGLMWPVKGPITSPFGWRINPIWHSREFHQGIDIAVGTGTPVKAAAAGIVTYAGWMTGYGNVVIIYHGSDISTLYAHLKNFVVKKGQTVRKGQVIAYSDNTGWSSGPHLHFGVYLGEKPVDPLKYLP
jgi:murein DD-endopeptidase MepM/ murein hydrolase activator NlpD